MNDPTDFQLRFRIELIKPSQRPDGVRILTPKEFFGSECRIYPTHVQILNWRYGWTKYLAYFLGFILAYILMPLLGSLSATASSYKMQWEKIRWIKFLPAERVIDLCGMREEDGRIWLCSFKCDQDQRLLSRLTSFVRVEGFEMPS